jgi:hypothetical protein
MLVRRHGDVMDTSERVTEAAIARIYIVGMWPRKEGVVV